MAKKHSKTVNNPHKSFRRTYKEELPRRSELPDIPTHIVNSFRILLKNKKLFVSLFFLVAILNIILVGMVDIGSAIGQSGLSSYNNAGVNLESFLNVMRDSFFGRTTEGAIILSLLVFVVTFLVTIFLLRHRMAKHKVRLRDGLYNGMTSFIPTLIVLMVVLIECLPILIILITYSAAIETGFLEYPFYAFLFLVFAVLMILISGYLLPGSIITMVAVSAPGLYPLQAFRGSEDLLCGRRFDFVLRMIVFVLMMIVIWSVIVLPLALMDNSLKSAGFATNVPFLPIVLTLMVSFTYIYGTTYVYLYYRMLLDAE